MQTRADMETELTNRLMIANNSETFSSSRITGLIQDAYLWAASMYPWPPLQAARVSTALKNTQGLNYDYYDYPTDFKTGSASRLYIDGKLYAKRAYMDLLDYADNVITGAVPPDPTKLYFADYGRQYITYPSYTGTSPANNLILWGIQQATGLTASNSTGIFSQWNDAGNEAVVQKALAVAMQRLDSGLSAQNMQAAVNLLSVMWNSVTEELQRSQRLNHAFFNVHDMFGQGAGLSTLGNFTDVDIPA